VCRVWGCNCCELNGDHKKISLSGCWILADPSSTLHQGALGTTSCVTLAVAAADQTAIFCATLILDSALWLGRDARHDIRGARSESALALRQASHAAEGSALNCTLDLIILARWFLIVRGPCASHKEGEYNQGLHLCAKHLCAKQEQASSDLDPTDYCKFP